MVSFGQEVGRVEGKINKYADMQISKSTSEDVDLEVVLTTGEVMGMKTQIKKYSINGVPKRMLDFVGTFKVVLFWPQDMELVTDSPTIRRRYLDFVLCQVDREYRRSLISYEKGLRQRNKLLEAIREKGAHRHQLIFWDQLLIKSGEYITRAREGYIDFVNRTRNYQLVYDKSIISRLRLDQYVEEEIAAGATLVGPHRDDMEFRIKNAELRIQGEEYRSLSCFGSRGEQRLAILWLKIGELSFIEEKTGEKPVLLLDDILSELDHDHRKIIFDLIINRQTIITTTDKHLLPRLSGDTKVIELE